MNVAEILFNSYSYSYEIGKLSISQRSGCIRLKPKLDAERNSIKNWRPSTLLNFDYKRVPKAILSKPHQNVFPTTKPASLVTDLSEKIFI